MDMKTEVAKVLNEVVMEELERPTPVSVDGDALVTSGGRLKDAGWMVSTVVRADNKSISFSVQLPGGRGGYITDILNEFVDAPTVRKYAEHALARILTMNGLDVEGYVKA